MKTLYTYLKRRIERSIKFLSFLIVLLSFSNKLVAQQQFQIGSNSNSLNLSIAEASFIKEGHNNSPYPSFVRIAPTSRVSENNFLPWLKSAINLRVGLDFRQIDVQTDELGFTHYKLIETYQGVPIDGAIYIVHAQDGFLTSFSGNVIQISELSARPMLTIDAARASALNYVGAEQYAWEDSVVEAELKEDLNRPDATYFPAGELVWSMEGTTPELAYTFDIFSLNPENYEQRIYVNANTGVIIQSLPLESNCDLAEANTIYYGSQQFYTDKYKSDTWRMRDDCIDSKIKIRDWGSTTLNNHPEEIDNTTNTWTTDDEVFGASVLWGIKNAYYFYKVKHNRNSYDNNGGNINGFINAVFDCGKDCTTTSNASMSATGRLKVGLSTSGNLTNSYATQDILAHEYTHAVTRATADLKYKGESGALNESFSDIFGEVIENYVFGSNDWLMGAERDSGAMRSLSNPKLRGQPDTYGTSPEWVEVNDPPCNKDNDECGVHTNSGVQNYWFYLLCQGGSGTNDNNNYYQVDGIGIESGRRIAYRTLVSYLGPNSNYADARENSIQAAIDLFGMCSKEMKAVVDAWHAVGVGEEFLYIEANPILQYNGSPISCNGACDGQIFAFGGGAFATEEDTLLNGLCAGEYLFIAEDVNGCTEEVIVELVEPEQLSFTVGPKNIYNGGYNISCYGGEDGGAIANVTGGTPPYKYLWSTGETTESIINLTSGVYWVMVSDANGCNAGQQFVTLIQPSALTAFALGVSDYNGYNVSCHGRQNGSAEAFPIGGVPPYHYEWDDFIQSTLKIADSLRAKTYSVEIRDANWCIVVVDVTLTEPSELSATANVLTHYNGYNVSCNGGNDGAAEAIVVGGVAPYQYLWDNVNQSQTSLAAPLMADTYTVEVTDANNCLTDASVSLIQPEPLSIEALGSKTVYYGFIDSACANLTTANAMGGVPPYTLEWSTGETTESINVCPNATTTYYVTITDQHGCTFTDSVLICVIDVRCGNNLKGVLICHSPGSNKSKATCVPYKAAVNHLAHGDQLGDCNTDKSCPINDNAKLIKQKPIQENESFLKAFPNPFNDRITLSYIPASDDNLTVELVDITGKVVGHIFNGNVMQNTPYTFDYQATELPDGMYFIKLETSTGIVAVEKVIRSRK